MLLSRQKLSNPDHAAAPVVGRMEMRQPGALDFHCHSRHQLMLASTGVMHVSTTVGTWVLPPTRAIWIRAGTEHSLVVKRPAQTHLIYIDGHATDGPAGALCSDECDAAGARTGGRLHRAAVGLRRRHLGCPLARVLLDQFVVLPQASVDLPLPTDPRAVRVVDILRHEPGNRESLAVLAVRAGSSARTIERLFLKEARLSFGAWRHRLRLVTAVERLAYGESVTNVAFEVGHESPSSFVAAFRAMFGTTPGRYFKTG